MKFNLLNIINEEIISYLNEDVDWDLYEKIDEIKQVIFNDYLNNNNENFTKKTPWRLIPFYRLKKIWEDYIKYGFVRDEKGLDYIEGIVTGNIIKIYLFTELSGHTSESPDDDFEDFFGGIIDDFLKNGKLNFNNPNLYNFLNTILIEKTDDEDSYEEKRFMLMDKLKDNFWWYYTTDKNGVDIISDYGLTPLLKLLDTLRSQDKPEEKLVTIDKILNVVHQRSDIASWFIEGGSNALSQLSGYEVDDESGWGNTMSSISGKYKMGDYRD